MLDRRTLPEDDLGPATGIRNAVVIAVVLWAGGIVAVSLYAMW